MKNAQALTTRTLLDRFIAKTITRRRSDVESATELDEYRILRNELDNRLYGRRDHSSADAFKMPRVFIDLDGPTVDYDLYREQNPDVYIRDTPGAYFAMEPTPDALAAIRSIIGMGYNVFIATRPCHGRPLTYSEKVAWVLKYLPELDRKIILTHDKGLLGDGDDFLVDDMPEKANCDQFKGRLLVWEPTTGWALVLATLAEFRLLWKREKIARCYSG